MTGTTLLSTLPLLILLALPLPRPFPCAAAARDSLPRGASIAIEEYATHVLVSPDGTFACGFYNVSPTVFTFSVWFARAADRTVVWTANRARPVHSKGSRLKLDGRRSALVLTDYDSDVVWNSTTANASATRARLHDSGNLAVEDARGNVLWQSFDHPTDTLLPTLHIVAGKDLVSADKLLAAGYYSFRFSDYAMLSLMYDNREVSSIYWPNPYFSYWQNSRKIYNFSRQAALDSSGHFLASDNVTFDAADLGDGGVKRRLTLDTDGNLRLYSLDKTVGTWTVSWMAFSNPSIIHGVCGANAVCLYAPAPVCVCAPGHERVDRSDWSRGCRSTFNSTVDGVSSQPMKFVTLPHTDFWGFDLNNSEFLSLDGCEAQCINEPSCMVFQYKQGKGECYPKSLMFNGRTFPGLPGTAYVKVLADFDVPEVHVHQWQTRGISGLAIQEDIVRCGGASLPEFSLNVSDTSRTSNNQGKSIWFYFYEFLSAFFVIEVIVIAFGCWLFSKKGVFRPSEMLAVEEGYRMITSHFRAYSYSELERATRKFCNEIGRSGSGIVYKGILDDERAVAIKVLQDVCQSEEVFQAELSVIGRIYHMNLVRMWGFCSEGTHRILVCGYIENGSLAKVLFQRDASASMFLGWKQRFNIALGVAKGLAYLHNECLEWIIHCDMKPENILLDADMEPKITDFGLAKLLNRDGSDSDTHFPSVSTNYHGLPRHLLQDLSKKNGIKANMSNVAMANALQLLASVTGIDEIKSIESKEDCIWDRKASKRTAAMGDLNILEKAKNFVAKKILWIKATFRGAYWLRFWALQQHEDKRETFRLASKALERPEFIHFLKNMAPEWVSCLLITDKVDVYSYGVVLLELMKGRRISDWVVDGKEGLETDVRTVVKMIVDKLKSNNEAWIVDLMDERLDGQCNHVQAKMIVQLAVSCLEEERNKRPTMKHVVQMLISADDEAKGHQYSPI